MEPGSIAPSLAWPSKAARVSSKSTTACCPRWWLASWPSAWGGPSGIDVVRNHIFASLPTNYDHLDEGLITRQNEFYKLLREDYHYDTELFNIDFRGRRVRQADRDPADSFQPREKCVDIALASKMLYQAAMPFGMDIAAAVLGDRDFTPVLQTVRQLGKRVLLVSVRSSCAQELADPEDRERVKDYDTLWMDDHIEELELRYEPQWLECQSPEHEGERRFQTTYRPAGANRSTAMPAGPPMPSAGSPAWSPPPMRMTTRLTTDPRPACP